MWQHPDVRIVRFGFRRRQQYEVRLQTARPHLGNHSEKRRITFGVWQGCQLHQLNGILAGEVAGARHVGGQPVVHRLHNGGVIGSRRVQMRDELSELREGRFVEGALVGSK